MRNKRIFFYHTEDSHYIIRSWERGCFPGHFLYGATHFAENGIDMAIRKHRDFPCRLFMMLDTARQVFICQGPIDAIFATRYEGLEIIIMLRALGLYRKKIVVWHHQPIVTSGKRWKEWIGKIFYKGIDQMFFFSEKILEESAATGKARRDKMHLGHWGPDLRFYDKVIRETKEVDKTIFISTGRERRDMKTLVEAFNQTGRQLYIYTTKGNCGNDYESLLGGMEIKENVHISFTGGYQQNTLCYEVAKASCAVVCCLETNYTCGLTSIVEAMALGKPVICSRNIRMPFDAEKEGFGITVGYNDVDGWKKAIEYISTHPKESAEMGRKGRKLAEERFNDYICSREISDILLSE